MLMGLVQLESKIRIGNAAITTRMPPCRFVQNLSHFLKILQSIIAKIVMGTSDFDQITRFTIQF